MAARQKKQALTTRAAIEKVLSENGGKMKVREIIEAAVPLTSLAGKTPGQAVYSVLYTDAKKANSVFKQTGKGEFKLDKKAVERRDAALSAVRSGRT